MTRFRLGGRGLLTLLGLMVVLAASVGGWMLLSDDGSETETQPTPSPSRTESVASPPPSDLQCQGEEPVELHQVAHDIGTDPREVIESLQGGVLRGSRLGRASFTEIGGSGATYAATFQGRRVASLELRNDPHRYGGWVLQRLLGCPSDARWYREDASAPPAIAAITAIGDLVLLSADGDIVRTVLPVDGPSDRIRGISISPDKETIFFGEPRGDCFGISRVSVDTGEVSPVDGVVGSHPVVSPDGKRLAFRSVGPGTDCLFTSLGVIDLVTGATRLWHRDPQVPDQPDALGVGRPTWDPSGRFLAISRNYEGPWEIRVIDTEASATYLTDARVIKPGPGEPAWGSAHLAFHDSCCVPYTPLERSLVKFTSPSSPLRTESVVDIGVLASWIDYDAGGEHLLLVETPVLHEVRDGDGAAYRFGRGRLILVDGGGRRFVGEGFLAADW